MKRDDADSAYRPELLNSKVLGPVATSACYGSIGYVVEISPRFFIVIHPFCAHYADFWFNKKKSVRNCPLTAFKRCILESNIRLKSPSSSRFEILGLLLLSDSRIGSA